MKQIIRCPMKSSYPLVSVIVPNFNYSLYLKKRLESIFNQTYKNFEVIILDDKSTDNSLEIIEQYRTQPKVSQIIINEINSGNTFIQWDKGLHLAKGELIWIAESDDWCEPNMLEELVQFFMKGEGIVIAYSTSVFVDSKETPTWTPNITTNKILNGESYLRRYLLTGCNLYNASSAIFSREAALNVSAEYIKMTSAGDYMFWAELALHGKVAILNKRLNYFRRHCGAVSATAVSSYKNIQNDKKVYDYICSSVHISRVRQYFARVSRYDRIINGPFDIELKNKLMSMWGIGRLNIFDRILLFVDFHLRMRYNYYI